MIEPHGLIRAFLADDAALVALVGTGIYAGRDVPPPDVTPGDGDCLVFKIRGGNTHYDDALIYPSVQFKAYATSEVGAYAVYRALRDALHNGHDSNILHAEEEGLGQPLEEPDTEWRYVLAFFTVLLRQ